MKKGYRETELFPAMLKKMSEKALLSELSFIEAQFFAKAFALARWYHFDIDFKPTGSFARKYKDHGELTVKMALSDLDTLSTMHTDLLNELERRAKI